MQAQQKLERLCMARKAAQVLGFIWILTCQVEQTEFPIDKLNFPVRISRVEPIEIAVE